MSGISKTTEMNEDNINDILICECGKMIFHEECRATNKCLVCLITAYRQLEKDIKEISKYKIEELFHDASVLAGNQNRAEAEEVQYCRLKKVVGFYLDLTSGDLDKIVEITNDYKKYSKNFDIKYGLAEDESIAYKNLSEANADLLAALKLIHAEVCMAENLSHEIAIQQLKLVSKLSSEAHTKHKGG